jgi:hypothetical protein
VKLKHLPQQMQVHSLVLMKQSQTLLLRDNHFDQLKLVAGRVWPAVNPFHTLLIE